MFCVGIFLATGLILEVISNSESQTWSIFACMRIARDWIFVGLAKVVRILLVNFPWYQKSESKLLSQHNAVLKLEPVINETRSHCKLAAGERACEVHSESRLLGAWNKFHVVVPCECVFPSRISCVIVTRNWFVLIRSLVRFHSLWPSGEAVLSRTHAPTPSCACVGRWKQRFDLRWRPSRAGRLPALGKLRICNQKS